MGGIVVSIVCRQLLCFIVANCFLIVENNMTHSGSRLAAAPSLPLSFQVNELSSMKVKSFDLISEFKFYESKFILVIECRRFEELCYPLLRTGFGSNVLESNCPVSIFGAMNSRGNMPSYQIYIHHLSIVICVTQTLIPSQYLASNLIFGLPISLPL
jgi:hypothetical protein